MNGETAEAQRAAEAELPPDAVLPQDFNEKSDVWSYGVIMWELATGQEPWGEASPMQVRCSWN